MSRARARELANNFLSRGDARGWFDALYAEAEGAAERIPWADLVPNPHLVSWVNENDTRGEGRRALVLGCGLGDDSESLASRRFDVTAFDISAEAIKWCKRRYPDSKVDYVVADLFELPAEWREAFHFVVEVNTLQVLPSQLRPAAISAMVNCVTPGGTSLVIARGREPDDDPGSMPWPLTLSDLEPFVQSGLKLISLEDFFDREDPPVRRFRVQYRKPIEEKP
ncbi:MAG TPA: class I SAM-dependent methyltransferase [Blastocatellia bacterium]|jgi:SAM-dependent methyltransferase|nr:class I SAM-dependent methyltransferase [Blastocatellia bacterium]